MNKNNNEITIGLAGNPNTGKSTVLEGRTIWNSGNWNGY